MFGKQLDNSINCCSDQSFTFVILIGKVYQERLLLECLREQMKSKCLKDLHLRLKKVRQRSASGSGSAAIQTAADDAAADPETEEDLLYTIDCVKQEFTLADVPVDDVVAHADWLTIANHHVSSYYITLQIYNCHWCYVWWKA